MKLLDHPRGFEDEGHEKAWLIVCAANLCKDELKSARRKRTVGMSESMDAVMGEPDHMDETVDAVLRLPAKYKDCVYLHYYEGYKTAEIARMLGIPASTVRNRLRDARGLLKAALGGA